ncbi:MAG: ABC transporter ATP-binding protein [Chloroflexi bacterium]|nr:ABC transporter ATP-binding protein [Chloroflexota bacterium]
MEIPQLRPIAPAEPIVSLQGVTKEYRNGARAVVALDNVRASFAAGMLHAVVGRSGAGKSTLLNLIAGIDHVTSGEVLVQGVAVHTLSEDELAAWRGEHVGVVYQSFELLPSLSLLDNVMLPMQFAGHYDPRRSPRRALALLEQVGLADHAFKRPAAISGGQRQRVAIARALANEPQLLVADEPTGSLDSATAAGILSLLTELVSAGMTVIMVTHDQEMAAAADTLLRLHDGAIAEGRGHERTPAHSIGEPYSIAAS